LVDEGQLMGKVNTIQPTLYDLLARHWTFAAPITHLAFDAGDEALAFVLDDGRVAVCRVADEEAPQARYRLGANSGRATLSPRRRRVPPLPELEPGRPPLHLAAFGGSGFVAGGSDGHMRHVTRNCRCEAFGQVKGAVEAIVPLPNGEALVASAGTLVVCGGDGPRPISCFEGKLGALAVAPDGSKFALADARGISVRICSETATPIWESDLGLVAALDWSPDGRWIGAGLLEGAAALLRVTTGEVLRIPNYPTAVSSLAWSADASHFVTNGAYRLIVWSIAGCEQAGEALKNIETGGSGFIPVTAVSVHPRLPRIAAGYANGIVIVTQIGSRDELLVKDAGSGVISALSWSHDGQHLALGSKAGHAGIVTFPPHLFK
jgi:hypothetical protein